MSRPPLKPFQRVEIDWNPPGIDKKPEDLSNRDDGIGPLGSEDTRALTSHDHKVIPRTMPRGTTNTPVKLKFQSSDRDPNAPMTAEEWALWFRITWPKQAV